MKNKESEFAKVVLPIIRRELPKMTALDILGLTTEDVIRMEVEKIEAEKITKQK